MAFLFFFLYMFSSGFRKFMFCIQLVTNSMHRGYVSPVLKAYCLCRLSCPIYLETWCWGQARLRLSISFQVYCNWRDNHWSWDCGSPCLLTINVCSSGRHLTLGLAGLQRWKTNGGNSVRDNTFFWASKRKMNTFDFWWLYSVVCV